MAALIEDAQAMAIGMFLSIAISIILCMLSVSLISWSALRQVFSLVYIKVLLTPKRRGSSTAVLFSKDSYSLTFIDVNVAKLVVLF